MSEELDWVSMMIMGYHCKLKWIHDYEWNLNIETVKTGMLGLLMSWDIIEI